ncbi:myeloid-associated differentiation marker homolog [Oryzias melastigma]|uniref:Myeloid associated differentiation marker n=1 Tax=Oryzias melastigma TaxID=30732 RepID=A0A3B3BVL4_ORYME|nr:myeloid-associated differentiation marker homolog [Oryzias melastigma]
MPVLVSPPSKLFWVRVLAMVFSCVAFSVAKKEAFLPREGMSDWCMFCWVFSFTCTLIVVLGDLFSVETLIPVSWLNFSITVACYGALFCLSASVIFPLFFISNEVFYDNKIYGFRIVSTVFSCLATVGYTMVVNRSRASSTEVAGYMTTDPGLMKVFQTFVACVIFLLVSNPVSYNGYGPLQWCLAVYCICFILSMVMVMICVGESTGCLPISFPNLLLAHGFLGVAMYASATVLWPMYQFDEQYGGNSIKHSHEIAVAALTGYNLLLYTVDLAYSAKLVFITINREEIETTVTVQL